MKQVGLEQATGQGGPEEALAAFGETGGAEAIGFILAPEQAAFVRWQDDALRDADGRAVDLQRIFELRLFNRAADVRWRRRGNTGEYMLLREVEGGDTHWRRETQYLLWGERDGKQPDNDGWVRLSSPQVGSIMAPLRVEGGARHFMLRACEYFAAFEDGNIGFVAERLLGLAPAKSSIHCRGEGK